MTGEALGLVKAQCPSIRESRAGEEEWVAEDKQQEQEARLERKVGRVIKIYFPTK